MDNGPQDIQCVAMKHTAMEFNLKRKKNELIPVASELLL